MFCLQKEESEMLLRGKWALADYCLSESRDGTRQSQQLSGHIIPQPLSHSFSSLR